MTTIDVPGAQLHYDIRGSGPLMLAIAGANGDARAFTAVAEYLATRYTVAAYDRRGFSRSTLTSPQDYSHRLDTDTDDAHAVIEHTGHQTATVLGTSSGALIALHLLTRHPAAVTTVVAYEPPAVLLLADGQHWIDTFHHIYDRYRQSGIQPALEEFRERAFTATDRQAMTRAMDLTNPQTVANATYWLEHELRQYPALHLNLDALTDHAAQIIPAAGRDSRGHPCYQVSVELSNTLGRKLVELPGGHVGFATQPTEFALELTRALAQPENSPSTSGHNPGDA
jgi:pimeloyl-ACP methyl ester carboxylesterase